MDDIANQMEVISQEMERDDTPSSSEASFDMAPITQEFKQLADTLRDTNQNLHTFEFMVGQYRKFAKVAPIQNASSSNNFEEELKKITESIKSLESREGYIASEFNHLKNQLSERSEPKTIIAQPDLTKIGFLEGIIEELKNQLASKDQKCQALTEANHRLSNELNAEKERNLVLDKKLDSERKAAQIVAKDVQKYVDYANGLENQLKALHEKRLEESTIDKDMEDPNNSSVFCKTCLHEDSDGLQNPLELVVEKVEKLAENIENQNAGIIKELKKQQERTDVKKDVSRDQVDHPIIEKSHDKTNRDEKVRKKGGDLLKQMDFAEITAERDTLLIFNEKLQKEVNYLASQIELKEEKHKSLKQKCKTLLAKHRNQSQEKNRLCLKLNLAKKVLISVDQLCKMHEKNHGLLMNYFGGQVEVLGRLLTAFLGNDYDGPVLAVQKHKKLTEWFCSVHSVFVWTQKQLVSLGEKMWLEELSSGVQSTKSHQGKKLKKKSSVVDINTLSDISHSLDKDDNFPEEVMKILQTQDSVLKNTRESVNELKDVLEGKLTTDDETL